MQFDENNIGQKISVNDFNEVFFADNMETSCGLVLSNLGSILLLQYPQGHWDLPKGHVEDDDENHIATVRRELEEETGISDVEFVPGFCERSEYSYRHKGKKNVKQVYWYLGETESISIKLSREHRGHMWLEWDQALEMLTHEETRIVVKSAMNHMKSVGKL